MLYFLFEWRRIQIKKTKKESSYQAQLKKKLEARFEGCVVIKNDPTHNQGFPDLLILHNDKWAALEVKRSENEHHQPNQDDWVEELNNMSYSSFVYPENERRVLDELEQALEVRGGTRVPRSK